MKETEEVRKFIEDVKLGKTMSSKKMFEYYTKFVGKRYVFKNCLNCIKKDLNILEEAVKAFEMANFMVELEIPEIEIVKPEKIKKIKNEKK